MSAGGGGQGDPASARLFDLALQQHQAGRLPEAEGLYRQVLAAQPAHAPSLHGLGLIAHQHGRNDVAAELIEQALAHDPKNIGYLLHQGVILRQSGKLVEAEASYRRVLKREPKNATALGYLGNVLRDLDRLTEAAQTYRRALVFNRNDAATHHNLGVTLAKQGDHAAAVASYRKALALRPDNVEALNDLGVALSYQGKPQEAMEQLKLALGINPNFAEAYAHLGNVLADLGEFDEALLLYGQALAIKPGYIDAALSAGRVLRDRRRLTEALAVYDKVLANGFDDPHIHNNRGVVLQDLGRLDEMALAYDNAIRTKPDWSLAWGNKGHAEFERNELPAAIACYDEALRLNPHEPLVRGARLDCKLKLARWDNLGPDVAHVLDELRAQRLPAMPFMIMGMTDDPLLQRTAATLHGRRLTGGHLASERPPLSNAKRIRLGYFSPDFRDHPVAKLVFRLLESHDRERFEVTAFSYLDARGQLDRSRIEGAVDHFINVQNMTTEQLVALSRERGIDIAIDLAGYTYQSRPTAFAARLAPIQVNFLGYPGTVGLPLSDYIIADHALIDASNREGFVERVVYMPDTYGVNSYRSFDIDLEAKVDRAQHGLPEDAFVFCCFNGQVKILPEVFSSWMNILGQTPNSVLWLLGALEEVRTNLRREAEARGIDPARLRFASTVPFEQHIARYPAADLFLDTVPYNAHTTSADALWMGVPVLTRKGTSFAGRVAASFLTAVGLPELITDTVQAYEDMAVKLAADPAAVAKLKQKLVRDRMTEPLFDTARYARHLESAYERMLERHRAGLEPDDMDIGP